MFFDMWTCDGIIDFREFVVGLDVIERGTFEEKVKYCFDMYNIFDQGRLELVTLRALLKRGHSQAILDLDKAIKSVRAQ